MNDDAYWYGKTPWKPITTGFARLVKIEPMIGNGGPGTIYSATAFETATAKHGGYFPPTRWPPGHEEVA
jgi:hypothetical protein